MSEKAWQDLKTHHAALLDVEIRDLFLKDKGRFSGFSLVVDDVLLDYSKQRLTEETLQKLLALAKDSQLEKAIEALFLGEPINVSEKKPALHTWLRDSNTLPFEVFDRMSQFIEALRSGTYLGVTGKPICDVISIGIGGSDLGPRMVSEALQPYWTTDIRVHFIANLDGKTVSTVLKKCDPETTLCIINSKSFSTVETHHNAKVLQKRFEAVLGDRTLEHFIAVTANPEKAEKAGIAKERIFEFWDAVGGRYSIWSSVGLSVALLLGLDHFKAFLQGAYEMDQHFRLAPLHQNMPVLMALISVWNINFEGYKTLAVMPYEDGLARFPEYLQQLEMESNGKKAKKTFGFVTYDTAPIVWGGVGCNGQHAYMQLLHQGTHIVPMDFLMAAQGDDDFYVHHQLLMASCLSQSKALMEGTPHETTEEAKRCFGNRPSSTLLFPKLTPRVLGFLIALYEHKVFVEGVLWGINSFDQWGVELGKTLMKEILPYLEDAHITPSTLAHAKLDSSTQGLVDYIRRHTEF